jgi:hypothetical protein
VPKTCPECMKPVGDDVRDLAVFCSAPCRHAFNNRRATRGAQLYDLWMAHRYQRGVAKAVGVMALMCALGQQYREQDVQIRGHGWTSWLDPHAALAAKPWLKAKASRP